MTFSKHSTTYTVTHATTPAERGLDYLQRDYDAKGWTHTIVARRGRGTKDCMFHAHIANGEVVMTSEAW